MLIYSIAECTKWHLLLFFPNTVEKCQSVSCLLDTICCHIQSCTTKIQKSKVNLTSPNEENSSSLVMDVSGLETNKKMSELAFVSECQDFYTKALDDILYIFSSFPKLPK